MPAIKFFTRIYFGPTYFTFWPNIEKFFYSYKFHIKCMGLYSYIKFIQNQLHQVQGRVHDTTWVLKIFVLQSHAVSWQLRILNIILLQYTKRNWVRTSLVINVSRTRPHVFGFHVRLAVIKISVLQTGRGQDNTKTFALAGQPCCATLCVNRLRGSDHYRFCRICFNFRQLCMLSTEVTGHFSYFLHYNSD
jgi:hypothetical protein